MRVNSRQVKELKFTAGKEEGIVPEKAYIIRVRAVNSVGVSEPSDISDKVFAKDSDCKCTFLLVVLESIFILVLLYFTIARNFLSVHSPLFVLSTVKKYDFVSYRHPNDGNGKSGHGCCGARDHAYSH